MEAAGQDQAARHGGHILMSRNGAPPVALRGAMTAVSVAEDGHHTLSFKAVDVAGNESVEKEVSFKIDQTGPVGRFRGVDSGDPARLVADVADVTSGLADGWIEYRQGADGPFRRLASELRDGVLSARMPDQALADGRYEVRAVVGDIAGNRAVIDTREDGAPMAVALPLRAEVALDVRAERKAAKTCGHKRKRARRMTPCGQRPPALVKTVTVDHGRRVVASGTLSSGGRPLAGMTVLVEARIAGRPDYLPLGTAVTDERGSLRRVIPAGPSRAIRVRFAGTATLRPAESAFRTRARAAATLTVDRRRLLNGQAVRFTGRLRGKPIPAAGKLVALQAKVPGGWRTFATPRADVRGRFEHRYRFTSTTGLRRYRFRALVAPEPAYPYERGLSRTVAVVVRGR